MNAFFRRDYLYQFKSYGHNSIDRGTLRYLKFDNKTKEYVFLDGNTKHDNELEFRIGKHNGLRMLKRLNKIRRIGYEETDRYLKGKK